MLSIVHTLDALRFQLPLWTGYSAQRALREAQRAQVVVREKKTRERSCVLTVRANIGDRSSVLQGGKKKSMEETRDP